MELRPRGVAARMKALDAILAGAGQRRANDVNLQHAGHDSERYLRYGDSLAQEDGRPQFKVCQIIELITLHIVQ